MEEFDFEHLSVGEATEKFNATLTFLQLENYRRFSNDPHAGLDPKGIASISNLLLEEVSQPDQHRLNINKSRIISLIHNPVITLKDREDSEHHLIYHNWDDRFLVYFLNRGPEALHVFEKFAPMLKLNIQVNLLERALNIITDQRLNYDNMKYVPKIIETLFGRSAEHVDERTVINACQQCRIRSGWTNENSLLYVRIWHKLYSHFPTNNLTKISTQQGSDYAADLCEQLYFDGNLRQCVMFNDSSECFIMAYFILERNPFLYIPKYPLKIEAVGDFLASLPIENMGQLFINPNFMKRFLQTCKEMDLNGTLPAWKSIKTIVIKMCHYWRKNQGDLLFYTLQDIMHNLEKWNTDSIEFTFQMNEAAGRDIIKLSNYELDVISNELKLEAKRYPAAVLFYKYMYPTSFQKRDEILRKLSYDQSSFDVLDDQVLSVRAVEELYCLFRPNTNRNRLLNGNHEKMFGGTVRDWKSVPNLLKFIKAAQIAFIHAYGDELKESEYNREFFGDSRDGTKFFTNCQDYSLSLLLEILHFGKKSKYFAGFEFVSEELYRERKFRSQLNEEELQSFEASFSRDIFNSFRKYGEKKNNEIFDYITLLVDMFCISMEVTNYETAYSKLFKYFYVPVVKALILFSPLQTIRLIVAFCRSDLKLNLNAAYNNKSDLQKNWSDHQKEQSETERETYFKTFTLTVPDLMKKRNHTDQSSDLEFLMLTDYVGAVVNYRELFNEKEVIDYYILHKYYSKIGSQNITRHQWETKSEGEAQKLLLSP